TRRYPVVYALHGLFESPGFWEQRGLAPMLESLWQKGDVPEMVVVAVDGDNSFFVDGPAGRWEQMMSRDFVAHVESTYRVIPGRPRLRVRAPGPREGPPLPGPAIRSLSPRAPRSTPVPRA